MRKWLLFLMIIVIGVAPRIPLPIVIPGRRFDLRVEDLILVVLLYCWALYLFVRPKIDGTPLLMQLGFYMGVAIFATSFSLITSDLGTIRSFFYLLKELEYFIIFFIVANTLNTESDLKVVINLMLLVGFCNAVWVVVQLVTGEASQLFYVSGSALPMDAYQAAGQLVGYGPRLIGEVNPLATGGLFLVVFLLALSLLLYSKAIKKMWIYGMLSALFLLGILGCGSRVSLMGAIVGSVILLKVTGRAPKILPTLLVLVGLSLLVSPLIPAIGTSRFSVAGITKSFFFRWQEIWQPIIENVTAQVIFGYGKGSLGMIRGLGQGEAHNHFLRVFLETGIFGLMGFIWLLHRIISVSRNLSKKGKLFISKPLSCTTIAVTIALIMGAMVQDVFVPVILNELWWILIALMVVSYRIEGRHMQGLANDTKVSLFGAQKRHSMVGATDTSFLKT